MGPFFQGLVEGTTINVVVSPHAPGTISLKLKNVTISQVFEAVYSLYGYEMETIANDTIKINPAALQTRMFSVNYIDMKRSGTSQTRVNSSGLDGVNESSSDDSSSESEDSSNDSSGLNSKVTTSVESDFWSEINHTVTKIVGGAEGRSVVVSPMTSMVTVTAMPNELSKVGQYLKKSVGTLQRQVILEAKILEVELNDSYRAGINWAQIGRTFAATQIGGNINNAANIATSLPVSVPTTATANPTQVDLSTLNPLTALPAQAGAFGGVLNLGVNYGKFTAFLEMLANQGNVQVLSSPRVSTMNNQKALIKVGTDEFFVTGVTTSTTTGTGGATTSSPTIKFNSFFSGIALDVTPHIDDKDNVTLHIHPTVSLVTEVTKTVTLNSGNQTFPLAQSTIRESDSIVHAKSGELVVIGGMMQDKMAEVVSGVPYLMDLPFIGKLFRHTRQQATKSELVILLRPVVITEDQWNKELEKTYDSFGQLDRGFHLGNNIEMFGMMAEH
ncbi:MAG: pilus (MSHA type) biogenesis protein MshL [Francisellaceae bacterium]|nr:pilus (MSHA type) biogenesis protein MshL [Francisellaceae bacterium]